MKKALRSVWGVLSKLFLAVGLLYILLTALNAVLAYRSSQADKAEVRSDLNLPAAAQLEIYELYDDHGGFFGEGQSLWQLYPGLDEGDPADWTETDALDTADWNDLPVSHSAANFQEGSDTWYLLNWKASLDETQEGKWLLVNRGESDNGYLSNFTLYVYDSELGQLYCCQFDS